MQHMTVREGEGSKQEVTNTVCSLQTVTRPQPDVLPPNTRWELQHVTQVKDDRLLNSLISAPTSLRLS